MQEGFFKERGIYYRYSDFKPGRPTLFLVHGVSGSSSAWLPYEPEFESKYNVLSLDLRGHGKSVRLDSYKDYSIAGFSEDLYQLLLYCKVEKCILVSNSFGTIIALDFISKHQDMLNGLVFISPHFAIDKMRRARLIKPFLTSLVKLRPSFTPIKKTGIHIDYSKYVNTGDWNVRRTLADVGNTGPEAYLYAVTQTYDFNGEDILKEIRVPTLIIHGARDSIFPLKYAEMMAARIRNSEMVILEDADHIIVINWSRKVIEIMNAFLSKLKS